MASLSNDSGGTRRILFGPVGSRKAIRLGKISKSAAQAILGHVEHLISAQFGSAVPPNTAEWLRDLEPKLHDRLVRAGLTEERAGAKPVETLGWLIDTYKARKYPTYKPGTIMGHDQTVVNLEQFFGREKPVREFTEADAEDFRDWLLTAKPDGGGLVESTARKRCSIAAKMLRYAIKARIIDRQPFDEVPRGNLATEDYAFVGADVAQAVMEELPTKQWKLLFALSRWGGLRIGSEARKLRWGDIDWKRQRFLVHSPKTERYRGHATRLVPIFPELAGPLADRFDEADEGDELVLPFLVGRSDASLRKTMVRAVERAGAVLWPRLWHNMRATRQTELEDNFPSHVVCKWLGNSKAVATKHYLKLTEEHFQKAAQKAAQHTPELAGTTRKPQGAAL